MDSTIAVKLMYSRHKAAAKGCKPGEPARWRWRTGRDSNPRDLRLVRFQGGCIKPLCHLSRAKCLANGAPAAGRAGPLPPPSASTSARHEPRGREDAVRAASGQLRGASLSLVAWEPRGRGRDARLRPLTCRLGRTDSARQFCIDRRTRRCAPVPVARAAQPGRALHARPHLRARTDRRIAASRRGAAAARRRADPQVDAGDPDGRRHRRHPAPAQRRRAGAAGEHEQAHAAPHGVHGAEIGRPQARRRLPDEPERLAHRRRAVAHLLDVRAARQDRHGRGAASRASSCSPATMPPSPSPRT